MANMKPFVTVACFCEKVLEEADHVMTAIRIVDIYYVPPIPDAGPDGPFPAIVVEGLVSLKSGDLVGSHTIAFVMENTQGARTQLSPVGGWPVVFEGGEHGVNLKLKFPIGVKNFGLCWFDVIFDDEVLTRIPLRLRPLSEAPTVAAKDAQ